MHLRRWLTTIVLRLASLGIESVLVEPGLFNTSVFNNSIHPSDTERTKSYGSVAQGPEQILQTFFKVVEEPNTPNNPQEVANIVAQLISLPAGQRPFRTVVDRLGMAPAIEPYNRISEKSQHNIYTALGMVDMLMFKLHDTSLNVEQADDPAIENVTSFHFRR